MALPGEQKPLFKAHPEATIDDIQPRFPVASFTVKGRRVAFPILGDSLTGGNRIVRHARPYRHGVKCDDTGGKERVWTLNGLFTNREIQAEEGLDPTVPHYPDLMFQLIDLFNEHETGDLVVPIDGKVRARAEAYSREQREDEVDTAHLQLVFVEDNEDNVAQASFGKPSVKGSSIRLIEQTRFTAEKEGAWTSDLSDLREFASELEGLLRAPGRAVDDVNAKVRAMRRSIEGVERAARESSSERREQGFVPVGSQTLRELARLKDLNGFAEEERQADRPRRIPYTVRTNTTIFQIASDVRQSVAALLELNASRIDDPLNVEPGVYRVYDRPV